MPHIWTPAGVSGLNSYKWCTECGTLRTVSIAMTNSKNGKDIAWKVFETPPMNKTPCKEEEDVSDTTQVEVQKS